jgi:hypothetical protein
MVGYVGGVAIPIGGVAIPIGGVAIPIGGVAIPIGGVAIPIGGVAIPIGGVAIPIGGVAIPIGGVAIPIAIFVLSPYRIAAHSHHFPAFPSTLQSLFLPSPLFFLFLDISSALLWHHFPTIVSYPILSYPILSWSWSYLVTMSGLRHCLKMLMGRESRITG